MLIKQNIFETFMFSGMSHVIHTILNSINLLTDIFIDKISLKMFC